ncbi:hypothetical protein Fmac_027278 [Flemingia macrophylla]|uniref:Uncharacterized protein n=1 Tax=Flemingia macrophylla TaxID=520843 RepID=A0ABD1LHB1_9FABA
MQKMDMHSAYEVGISLSEKLQHGLDERFDRFRLEGTGRLWEGAPKRGEREWQGDFNGDIEVLLRERGVDVLHGGD